MRQLERVEGTKRVSRSCCCTSGHRKWFSVVLLLLLWFSFFFCSSSHKYEIYVNHYRAESQPLPCAARSASESLCCLMASAQRNRASVFHPPSSLPPSHLYIFKIWHYQAKPPSQIEFTYLPLGKTSPPFVRITA